MEHPLEENIAQGNLYCLAYPHQEHPMTKNCRCGLGGALATTEALEGMCAIAPAPELRDRLKAELANLRESSLSGLAQSLSICRDPRRLGFNDGVIIPPSEFELGTAFSAIRGAAAERAPLRGAVRVIVVLVDFSDRVMVQPNSHFRDLFFSTGVLPHGSVKEYYREVSGGLVDITGEVVGPFRMPETLAWYANGNSGIGRPSGEARAKYLARDAAQAADPSVNFAPYDNDGNGYVDAFIVIHAGSGGEQTGNSGDIWSHKWNLPSVYNADGTNIYAYLTVPEDSRIGVCAHELGHLLFGFPDLYDTDYTSEGIGNWCLMAGGSWNGGGEIPAHPSAWCKLNQGWVGVTSVTSSGSITLPDVKSSRNVHRLWKDGAGGSEYFLLENRQLTGYDAGLPGDGLLIWHIDESQPGNTDESHYKVALLQADGKRDMESDRNRGDSGDPYPGSLNNTVFNSTSSPNSKSYGGADTCVSVSGISPSGASMTATVAVSCKSALKDRKDLLKEGRKEIKDRKEITKELKEIRKETKEISKERKDLKDRVEVFRPRFPFDRTAGTGADPSGSWSDAGSGDGGVDQVFDSLTQLIGELESRIMALEASQGTGLGANLFIGGELRPDLVGGPDYGGQGDLQARMQAGDRDAKVAFDNLPS